MRPYFPGLFLAAISSFSAASAAQEPKAPPAPPPRAKCPTGSGSAIAEVACELHRQVGRTPGALLVASPITASGVDGAKLTDTLARVVAGQLNATVAGPAKTLGAARNLASRKGTLLYLRASIAAGEVRVNLDKYPVPKNFWARIRDPRPAPSKHAFASRRFDPELRTFMPRPPLLAKVVVRAKSVESKAVALACEDLDGDGALDLVVVGRRRIHTGRISAGRFKVERSVEWSALSPIAPAPLRQPIAAAEIVRGQGLRVGITDRRDGLHLDARLGVSKRFRALPWPGGGCANRAGVYLHGAPTGCGKAQESSDAPEFDAIAGATVLSKEGAKTYRAGRVQQMTSRSYAVLSTPGAAPSKIPGVGAQLAVGDLNGDGQVELVAGTDTQRRKNDAIQFFSVRQGAVTKTQSTPAPGGVDALAICPAETNGRAAVVAAVGAELWVLR